MCLRGRGSSLCILYIKGQIVAGVIVAVEPKAEQAWTDGIYFKDAGFVVLPQTLVIIFRTLFDSGKEFYFTFFNGSTRGFGFQVSMVLVGGCWFSIDYFFFLFYLSSRIIYLVSDSRIHAGLQDSPGHALCDNRCPAAAGSFR